MSFSSVRIVAFHLWTSGLHSCALAWILEHGVCVSSFWRVAVQLCLCFFIVAGLYCVTARPEKWGGDIWVR